MIAEPGTLERRAEGRAPASVGLRGRPPEWYEGVPAVTVEVACGGRAHRLSWRRGKLVLEDHDVAGERAMIALGGPSFTCLDLLNVWEDGARDLHAVHRLRGQLTPFRAAPAASRQVFVTGSQLPSPSARQLSQLGERQRQQLEATFRRRERARLLWALPPDLHVRLALSAVMHAERADEESHRRDAAHLDETLRALAVPAMKVSMGGQAALGPGVGVDVDCASVPRHRRPSVDGKIDRFAASASIAVPWSWMATVWAWGLAVVDGAFVLAVTDADRRATVVRALAARWQSRPDGAWVPILGRHTLSRSPGRREWRAVG